jgi:transcription initiation factor TFIIIB Brf1 subunit/transcription initiation factor TFIIB
MKCPKCGNTFQLLSMVTPAQQQEYYCCCCRVIYVQMLATNTSQMQLIPIKYLI